jgi:hypothetical protein
MVFGDDIGINYPAQSDDWLELTDKQWFRYKPTSQEGEWEDVSFDITVDTDFDLESDSLFYVYGHYGPEGLLWVEGLQINRTTDIITTTNTPIFDDFVGYIQSVDDKNKLTLTDTYDNFVTTNLHKADNEVNLRSWSTYDNFYVNYTSSFATSTPVYGSLRGEIQGINDNTIVLSEGFISLGEDAGHDFSKYPMESMLPLDRWFIQYPKDRSEPYSKLLKYGPNEFSLITNFKVDKETYPDYPYSVVYKLYEPLPDVVQEKDFITIVREMAPPLEEVLTLYPFVEEWVSDTVLRTPEIFGNQSAIGQGRTEFKTYDELVSTDTGLKQGVENEIISGSLSADINVDHSQFSNFVHFGSVEKRVRNFKYKLELIEQYTDRSASLAGAGSSSAGYLSVVADPNRGSYLNVSGSSGYNPAFTPVSGSLTQVQSWEQKRRDMINTFDKFEKYMFYESSSYSSESIGIFYGNTWPKREGAGTYISPYLNYRTTQSVATTWFDNQITSASAYDRQNKNRVRSHLPLFVQDDTDNNVFLNFIDMIGHYFDDIWIFIKALTDIHDKRDKLTDGIAKDLLKPIAQSLGWEVHDGKDLVSLKRYIYGMEQSGSETPWQHSVTPDRDISREIWSRVINNMPYFLKTKGTARAIKGLISCYGIPSSILRVIEYGGPSLPGLPLDTFLTRKFTKALNFYGALNNTYVQNNTWKTHLSGSSATSRVPDTVEFRFRAASGSNQVLVRRGDDWGIRLKDNSSVDNYGYVSFMLSGSKGYNEVTSSELPVYDGEFWSVMLTRTSASGYTLVTDSTSQNMAYNLHVKKYDSGRSKIIYESSNTLAVSGALGAVSQSYNLAYSGSAKTVTIGGPESSYFGESLSGSMMEYRNWTQPLNTASFDNHVSAPIAFDGNSPSASYLDLITRYSFDDDKDLSVGANQWFRDVSADQSFTSSAVPSGYTSGLASNTDSPTHFSRVVDETNMKVPNLGPNRIASNKLRIEADSLIDRELSDNPILEFGKSITIPAYDRASIDSNKLGIFFSPSQAINEDIILSMPNLDFDQYIGDPRDQYNEQYTGLVEARNLYWKKYSGPNNFWDFLRLLKYYDSSLYDQVRSLIPARANATVGILIEPTILERDKIIIGKEPTFIRQDLHSKIIATQYISESAQYPNYESSINFSHPFKINYHTQETGSFISASSEYLQLESKILYSHPFDVNFYNKKSGSFYSASAEYIPLDSRISYGRPYVPNFYTKDSGSLVSASAEYQKLESVISYSDPFRINYHTKESGSFISASALYQDLGTNLNLRNPFMFDNRTQTTGSIISMSADFTTYNAPSDTLAANANGTGSFVIKHILERPALYGVGDRDTSGWYGNDYYNSTIQQGAQKSIREEVVMPRYENKVISELNKEVEYHFSSSLSASLGLYYSSSFVLSDFDNKWEHGLGTDRLFYIGCIQDGRTTVSDKGNRYQDETPAVDITITSPTKLVTTDSPSTKLDVV